MDRREFLLDSGILALPAGGRAEIRGGKNLYAR